MINSFRNGCNHIRWKRQILNHNPIVGTKKQRFSITKDCLYFLLDGSDVLYCLYVSYFHLKFLGDSVCEFCFVCIPPWQKRRRIDQYLIKETLFISLSCWDKGSQRFLSHIPTYFNYRRLYHKTYITLPRSIKSTWKLSHVKPGKEWRRSSQIKYIKMRITYLKRLKWLLVPVISETKSIPSHAYLKAPEILNKIC